jgi:hypothetical protein
MSQREDQPPAEHLDRSGTPPDPNTRDELRSSSAAVASAINPQSLRAWLLVVAIAPLAGLCSFGIGELAPSLVPPSRELSPELRASGPSLQAELRIRDRHSKDRAAALAYGGLGLFLGLGLGAAGGLSRQSTRAAFTGAIVGLVLGGLAGGATTSLILPSFHAARAATPAEGAKPEDITQDLGLALLTHGAIWAAVGGAAGLALGLGLGGAAKTGRAVVGGILGACLGTVVYEFSSATLFPLSESFRPMAATPGPRLLAHIGVAMCISVFALWAADHLRLRRGST